MTAKILFLDDMMWRHREFRRVVQDVRQEDALIYQAWSAGAAIDLLERVAFDQVFLDHDLSEDDIMVEIGAQSAVPTGMTVVDHICQMSEPPQDVIIHSCNGPAAVEMARRLEACGRIQRIRALAFPYLIELLNRR